MERTNTDFPLYLARTLATATWSPEFDVLYYHQNIPRIYFKMNIARGQLAYHATGTGKSIYGSSVIFDEMFPDMNADGVRPRGRKVIILLVKSLAHNMIGAMESYLTMRANAIEQISPQLRDHSELGAILALPEEERKKWLHAQFKSRAQFVTMNASNMMEQMARVSSSMVEQDEDLVIDTKAQSLVSQVANLDDCLLVVDEAHGLFRAIINGSRNAATLYQHIMRAKNLRLLFLTGTPIASDPFEMAICFNMLAGAQIFPIQYNEFAHLFIAQDGVSVRNRHVFQNRIMGLVSHVTSASTIGVGVPSIINAIRANESAMEISAVTAQPRERAHVHVEFPEEYPLEVVRVPMDIDQYNAYISARDQEKMEGLRHAQYAGATVGRDTVGRDTVSRDTGARDTSTRARLGGAKVVMAVRKYRPRQTPALQKPKSEFSSTYRVHSRQISNYCPPAEIRRVVYEVSQDGGKIDPESLLTQIGTIDSAKYRAILARLREREGQLGLIYSQFIGIGGLASLARFLDQNGYQGKWAIVSGEIDAQVRAETIARFSAHDNAHGEKIALLLISATGAEGIDLKNVRHVHILEPYWNYGRIRQVKARAIRNRSHDDLPPEERNVSTFLYLAVRPKSREQRDDEHSATPSGAVLERTSDEELYENSRTGQLLVSAFEDAIREVSIECALNHEPDARAKSCRMCAPTGTALFSASIEQDIDSIDPCRAMASTHVKTKRIKLDDREYYYRTAEPGTVESSVYGYELFVLDPALRAWRKLPLNDEYYETVVEAIAQAARDRVKK